MLNTLVHWYRPAPDQPYVRPWGLAVPVLVLIVCLPLLRPLRQPEMTRMSDSELARLATVQALVEQRSLAIDNSVFRPSPAMLARAQVAGNGNGEHYYSKQPPVLAALLAGPYWLLHRLDVTFERNMALATYLLTLLSATLPAAMTAGLVYRLGRLFELRRPWRMLLAFSAVFGSGLLGYATVINSHAPAAALLVGACGALLHAGMTRKRSQGHAWLAMAGLSAGLAAVIDLPAFVFLFLLVLVILTLRWPVASRVGGVLCYTLGALPALALHAALTIPLTGDLRPGLLHPELLVTGTPIPTALSDPADDAEDEPPSRLHLLLARATVALLGGHGILTRFPILLLGLAGIAAVLHRNWPGVTKAMAAVTLAGALIILAGHGWLVAEPQPALLAAPWFVPFLPLVAFWGGVWLRNPHRSPAWTIAAVLLGFSVAMSLLTALEPPHPGPSQHLLGIAPPPIDFRR